MKQLIKIKNSDLSLRLNLNYNSVYARLKMLLGGRASLFADLSAKSQWTWFADDDADYTSLADAPQSDIDALSVALTDAVGSVRRTIAADQELSKYVEDILEIPDNGFVFYRQIPGGYKFVLAGWGCRYAHQSTSDPISIIKRSTKDLPASPKPETSQPRTLTDILNGLPPQADSATKVNGPGEGAAAKTMETPPPPAEVPPLGAAPIPTETSASLPSKASVGASSPKPKQENKRQNTVVRVLDQNSVPVKGESVVLRSSLGEVFSQTTDDGTVPVGELPYGEFFSISFPNLQKSSERSFEVVSGVDVYDAYIKKLVKYSPVLFVEDQNGLAVQNYDVKVIVNGQDFVYNSGEDGVIQLPTMREGQKFSVVDPVNYANAEDYNVTSAEAKTPYRFLVRRPEKTKVGVTVLDKAGKPIPHASVHLAMGDTPCQAITAENGRAEFPSHLFAPGDIPAKLSIRGQGDIPSTLRYTSGITEYTLQLRNSNPHPVHHRFDWKWLALLPLLLLLGWGGYELYKHYASPSTPRIEDMESGVGLILVKKYYYVDLELPEVTIDGHPAIAYFNYDENEHSISNLTYDPDEATYQFGSGTGFLISDDGLIATNRHIASPIPPAAVGEYLKRRFQGDIDKMQAAVNELEDQLRLLSGIGKLDDDYKKLMEQLRYYREQVGVLTKIINVGQYKVEVRCVTSIAFTNTRIEDEDDFIACSQPRAYGEPGGVTENDVAIIQIKKKQDVPQNAYIFTVPEKDLMDENLPDDYEITVLGYNDGFALQNMRLQNGIKPHAQHGKITKNSEKYRIQYDAPTLGGSSGSPVINKQGQLVGINNSGVGGTQGFNFGVRTKYLRELLDEVQKNNNNNNNSL